MSESDPLELTSLDTESLLAALLNAEKVRIHVGLPHSSDLPLASYVMAADIQAIPSLLQDIKPVLAHLKESDPTEDVSSAAKVAVDRYMNTLDVSEADPEGRGRGGGDARCQAGALGPPASITRGGLYKAGQCRPQWTGAGCCWNAAPVLNATPPTPPFPTYFRRRTSLMALENSVHPPTDSLLLARNSVRLQRNAAPTCRWNTSSVRCATRRRGRTRPLRASRREGHSEIAPAKRGRDAEAESQARRRQEGRPCQGW